MEFLVTGAATEEQAEDVWRATVKCAKENTGWDIVDRRIYRIEYFDIEDRKSHVDEVGKPHWINGERVLVILESNAYLVCTGNRGVLRGQPILVGKQEVSSVTEFE